MRVVKLFRETRVQEKTRQGYKGIQTAAEMDVFFEKSKTTELLAYERLVGRKLSQSICGMCMYDALRLEPGQVMSLIETHGHAIFERIAPRFL